MMNRNLPLYWRRTEGIKAPAAGARAQICQAAKPSGRAFRQAVLPLLARKLPDYGTTALDALYLRVTRGCFAAPQTAGR